MRDDTKLDRYEGPFLLEIRLKALKDNSRLAYDQLYEEEVLSQIDSFYLWLFDRMDLPSSGCLLDVSCGAGEVVALAATRGLLATGLDISEVVAKVAGKRVGRGGAITVGTGEGLPFPDGCFDIVTNIGSLEHFNDPGQGVQEMARVLRPGGKAYILVPNTFSLLTNIWIAYRSGGVSYDDQPLQRYGSRLDWEKLLVENGLAIKQTMKYEKPWPRTSADWGYYLRRPKEMARLFVSPLVPLNLAFCFLFSCEKLTD